MCTTGICTSTRLTNEKIRTGRPSCCVKRVERWNSCCRWRRRSIFAADGRGLWSATTAVRPTQTAAATTRSQSRSRRHIVLVSHCRHGFSRPETRRRCHCMTEWMVDDTWWQRLLLSAFTDVDESERRTCRATATKHSGTVDFGAESDVADQERCRRRFPLDDKASCVEDGWRSSGRGNRSVSIVVDVDANSHRRRWIGLQRRPERRYVKTPHPVVTHRGRWWRRWWHHLENSSRVRHQCWPTLKCKWQQSSRQFLIVLSHCCQTVGCFFQLQCISSYISLA